VTTVPSLIADVPELGKLTRREVSALIGVTPFNNKRRENPSSGIAL
jgi:hypothetical protein